MNVRSGIRILARALFIARVTLTAMFIALALTAQLAPHLGHQALIVSGASMEPAVSLGALAIISPVEPAQIAVGDVISFHLSSGALVTHRVTGVINQDGSLFFSTKGDASVSADVGTVPAAAIVGRLDFSVPVAGYALLLLSTPSGLIGALLILLALALVEHLLKESGAAARLVATASD